MSWFKMDDGMRDHDKRVRRLGKDKAPAMGVYSLAGTWCARPEHVETDGFIPTSELRACGDTARGKYAQRLVDEGLWVAGEHDGEPGFWFVEWLGVQESAAEKAAKQAQLVERRERERAGSRERMRRLRERQAAAARATNDTLFDEKAGHFSNEVVDPNDVTGVTVPPPVDGDYTPSDLDVSDSMTGSQRQRYVDRNASRTPSRVSIPSTPTSGDSGGEAYVGTAHELGSPAPQDPHLLDDREAALVVDAANRYLGQPRPDDADPAICDRHWHLRYREVWENVPNCRDCKRLREDLDGQAAAAQADAEAIRRREKAIRAACTECDEFGWQLDEHGRALSGPAVKHDCVAAAAARRGHLRVVGE